MPPVYDRFAPKRHASLWLQVCKRLSLNATGCVKSRDKNKYYLITFKIELRCKFILVYSFFISYSTRLFPKIRDNSKFMKTMAKH